MAISCLEGGVPLGPRPRARARTRAVPATPTTNSTTADPSTANTSTAAANDTQRAAFRVSRLDRLPDAQRFRDALEQQVP